jgi:elongation factor Ts
MANISASDVKVLRERTQAGMMDCKKALEESNGDMDKAAEWLRKKGLAAVSKKEGRIAAEGMVASYIHMGGKIGVLVEVNCESDFVGRGEDFQNFVKEVAMQICAANPQYLKREDVPAVAIEKEREIYKAQVMEQGKPAAVADKIVEGKLNKWFAEVCLMEQPWVREPKMTIEELRASVVQKTGENVTIRRFVRWALGEGIEKKKDDLAAEVARMNEAAKASAS